MSRRDDLYRVRTHDDAKRAHEHRGGSVRNGGNHYVLEVPKCAPPDTRPWPVGYHRGEMKPGMRVATIKWLLTVWGAVAVLTVWFVANLLPG